MEGEEASVENLRRGDGANMKVLQERKTYKNGKRVVDVRKSRM